MTYSSSGTSERKQAVFEALEEWLVEFISAADAFFGVNPRAGLVELKAARAEESASCVFFRLDSKQHWEKYSQTYLLLSPYFCALRKNTSDSTYSKSYKCLEETMPSFSQIYGTKFVWRIVVFYRSPAQNRIWLSNSQLYLIFLFEWILRLLLLDSM